MQNTRIWLSKLFNINPHEWRRVILLSFVLALPNAGIIWGSTIAYSSLLKQVGLSALPWVLVISSILSVLASAVYAAFVDRVPNDSLMIGIFALGMVGILIGLGFLLFGITNLAFPLLYLFFLAWAAAANPHFVTYINGFYDVQASKRILPFVSAMGRVGAIVAGLSMPVITRFLPAWVIILIWLGCYVAAALFILLIPRLVRDAPATASLLPAPVVGSDKKKTPSFSESMREGLRFTSQSPYLRWMAVSALAMMVLMSFLEYRSSQILIAQFPTTEAFAGFVGFLDGVANLFVLPMLLFGVSRLIARLGLGNVNIFFPGSTLVIIAALLRFPQITTAAVAYFDRKALRTSLQLPIDSLLFNAVPLRMRGRARAFVSGLVVPIGSLIGGLLLLPPLGTTAWFVTAVLGLVAILYVGSAIVIRQKYAQALVQMLEQEDYSFLMSQEVSELPMADPATLKRLQGKLEESKSHELRVFLTKLIAQIGGTSATPILDAAIHATAEGNTRSAMIEVLAAAELKGNEWKDLYTSLLDDPSGQVRQAAIAALEGLTGHADDNLRGRMLVMLEDMDLGVSIRALTVLVRSDHFYQMPQAVERLDHLLKSEDLQERVAGVRVLGESKQPSSIRQMMAFLSDPEDVVRLEAIRSIEIWANDGMEKVLEQDREIVPLLVEQVGALANDPVERIRQSALVILGILGVEQCVPILVNSLADPSAQVRATAVDSVVRAGRKIVHVVEPLLKSEDLQIRKMATVILGRVDKREFGSLVLEKSVNENLSAFYRNISLVEDLAAGKMYRSVAILRAALMERSRELSEEILYLLAAVYPPESITIIGDSLRNESQLTRANAIEALETLTNPSIARLIAPMFEPGMSAEKLSTIGRNALEEVEPLGSAAAFFSLIRNTESPWLRAITVFAVGEIGTGLRKNGSSPDIATSEAAIDTPRPDRGRRAGRRSGLDLLAALEDSGKKEPEAQAEAPEKKAPEKTQPVDPVDSHTNLRLSDIERLVLECLEDKDEDVKQAALSAQQAMSGLRSGVSGKELIMLSTIDRIIFLKEVPFFQDMTVDQLKVLASVCEEKLVEQDTRIFVPGDLGGVLFVVVSGKVAIEQEKRAGSFARLADMEAYSYFGETNFFDGSPHITSAAAIQDTLILQLRREPLIALARQNPELSLKLINVLSHRLRESNARIVDLTRSRPRELHKLYDQFD